MDLGALLLGRSNWYPLFPWAGCLIELASSPGLPLAWRPAKGCLSANILVLFMSLYGIGGLGMSLHSSMTSECPVESSGPSVRAVATLHVTWIVVLILHVEN